MLLLIRSKSRQFSSSEISLASRKTLASQETQSDICHNHENEIYSKTWLLIKLNNFKFKLL